MSSHRSAACASSKRSLTDVPAFVESGFAFESELARHHGPRPGIPADIAAELNHEIAATLG